MPNTALSAWANFVATIVLAVAASVGSMYTTFETKDAHRIDQARTEDMLKEIRQDVKTLLSRSLPRTKNERQQPPVLEGYGRAPLPQSETRRELNELLQRGHRNYFTKV